MLRKRAEEMIELMEKTKAETSSSAKNVSGEIYIGGGETEGFRIISKAAEAVRKEHTGIHFYLFSGNADDVIGRLDRGLLDFGILVEPVDIKKYDNL